MSALNTAQERPASDRLSHRWRRNRELLLLLIERDLKVRYRQTVLGAAWALLSPLMLLTVLSVFFGYLGRLGPAHLAYPAFLIPAMVAWQYFESSLNRASVSLIRDASILKKVSIPRILLVLASVISPLVDLLFGFLVMLGVLAVFGVAPTAEVLLLPVYLVMMIAAALGMALILAPLNGCYRDVQHALPAVMRLWFFATPVIYGVERVPEAWQAVYAINPMVTVVTGFRALLLGTPPPTLGMVAASLAFIAGVLVVGWSVFRRHEDTIVDSL